MTDPVGVPVEFCASMDQSQNRMRQFHTHAGARLVYLDHVQIATHDIQSAYAFYNDLGFRLAEYTATDGTDEIWGVWLKRKNNTQDVVYANGAGPRLHHVAYHTPEIANVVHGADVMSSLGLAETMDRAPGRHGIGNAFFIYYATLTGIVSKPLPAIIMSLISIMSRLAGTFPTCADHSCGAFRHRANGSMRRPALRTYRCILPCSTRRPSLLRIFLKGGRNEVWHHHAGRRTLPCHATQ